MSKSIDDLKAKLDRLVEERIGLAYSLSVTKVGSLEKLAAVQTAILAIEAVIKSGRLPSPTTSIYDNDWK
jgi:hypothetical protein